MADRILQWRLIGIAVVLVAVMVVALHTVMLTLVVEVMEEVFQIFLPLHGHHILQERIFHILRLFKRQVHLQGWCQGMDHRHKGHHHRWHRLESFPHSPRHHRRLVTGFLAPLLFQERRPQQQEWE